MEAATLLGHVPDTMFPAGFSHVGTAALATAATWGAKLAADLRTAFSNDKLSTAVGRRYRDNILANGGQPPPQ